MYDYDYYYEQEPSEIDLMVEEAVDKVKRIILLRAKDEVEQQTLKAEKIDKEYQNFKDGARKLIDDQKAEIKDLEKRLKTLQEDYDKKRTEIPALDYEIGDTVWIPHKTSDKTLLCPTCQGTGYVNIDTDIFGSVKISCPHCHGSEWKHKGNFVKKVQYWKYQPMARTICGATIEINEQKQQTVYYKVKSPSGYCNDYPSPNVNDIYADEASCQKRCEELNKLALEDAKQYIYNKENNNDK